MAHNKARRGIGASGRCSSTLCATKAGCSFAVSFRWFATLRRTQALGSPCSTRSSPGTGVGSSTSARSRRPHCRRGRMPLLTSWRACAGVAAPALQGRQRQFGIAVEEWADRDLGRDDGSARAGSAAPAPDPTCRVARHIHRAARPPSRSGPRPGRARRPSHRRHPAGPRLTSITAAAGSNDAGQRGFERGAQVQNARLQPERIEARGGECLEMFALECGPSAADADCRQPPSGHRP